MPAENAVKQEELTDAQKAKQARIEAHKQRWLKYFYELHYQKKPVKQEGKDQDNHQSIWLNDNQRRLLQQLELLQMALKIRQRTHKHLLQQMTPHLHFLSPYNFRHLQSLIHLLPPQLKHLRLLQPITRLPTVQSRRMHLHPLRR